MSSGSCLPVFSSHTSSAVRKGDIPMIAAMSEPPSPVARYSRHAWSTPSPENLTVWNRSPMPYRLSPLYESRVMLHFPI